MTVAVRRVVAFVVGVLIGVAMTASQTAPAPYHRLQHKLPASPCPRAGRINGPQNQGGLGVLRAVSIVFT